MNECPKERPILMSGPMVSAILADAKTQTRRVVRDADAYGCLTGDCPHWSKALCVERMAMASPYGGAGDRLWVRESFAKLDDGRVIYVADDPAAAYELHCTPSIHMPRKRCRLVLEVTGVRCERLRVVTSGDAKAEGIDPEDYGPPPESEGYEFDYVAAYAQLWDSLNAKRGYGWATNPWVWVVEFKRAQ